MEFAADLAIRGQALEELGETKKAVFARKRAAALAFPQGPGAVSGGDGLPERYEDMVRVEE